MWTADVGAGPVNRARFGLDHPFIGLAQRLLLIPGDAVTGMRLVGKDEVPDVEQLK